MLTQTQRAAFDEDGLVRVAGAVPRDDALRMADRIREFLATEEAIRHNSQHEYLAERPGGFQPLKRTGVFDPVGSSDLPATLDDLFGAGGWERPPNWGRPLVTYKVSEQPWDVPAGSSWHIHERPAEPNLPHRLTIFTVLSELRPRGGGTLLLAGSHRLIGEFGPRGAKTGQLRKALGERDPWLAELWGSRPEPAIDRRRRFLDDGALIDGVPMRVIEVTGEPGDAYIVRSDIFHAPAPNALDEPRIMLVGGVSVLAA